MKHYQWYKYRVIPLNFLRRLTIIAGMVIPCFLFAQTRMLTLEEASVGNPRLSAKNLSQLRWNGNSGNYFYVARNSLVKGYTDKDSRDTILKLQTLNRWMRKQGEDTLPRFPGISSKKTDQISFVVRNKSFCVTLNDSSCKRMNSWPENAENPDQEENTFAMAYTVNNNLYVNLDGKEFPVEISSDRNISFGSGRVHRNEFGISKGTFWSPSGDKLAYYYMNESQVTDYPLVNLADPVALPAPDKYPMAGQNSHFVKVHVFSLSEQKHIELETGADSSSYLTNVTWSPDGNLIYIAVLNRGQDTMQLKTYDAATGKFRQVLFTETDPKYVEPLNGPEFIKDDPGRFIWQSRRDGYNHLYLYREDGSLEKQLTSGCWEVSSIAGCDQEGKLLFFYCNRDNPVGRCLCSLDLAKGKIINITGPEGTHTCQISHSGNYVLDVCSAISFARRIRLLDSGGMVKRELLSDQDPMKEVLLGKMSVFTIRNKQNTELFCRLIKPAEFDSTKKYPVIIYVYGGPHSQLITDSWLGGAGLFLNYLAEQGYVVFTLDNRGTSNRGKDFEQAIFRNLGTAETEDQMCGVSFLKSLPWIDSTRIGVTGWSYGGFMTISMMLRNPGVFKAGVCGGPVIDWKYYEVMYGERYMDTPQSNPEGYKNASLLNYAKNLKAKLLIIQGYQDNIVLPQNSLSFIKKCVDEGRQVDYFIYPGHGHGVGGRDRIHLNEKMYLYFKENL